VGHQEGAGETRKHAQQGGGPSQSGVQVSDLESNSESRTTLPSNWSQTTIIETRQISRNILVLRHLFWAEGPCIELDSSRDTS
jgi:hypothetical protein